MKGIALNCAPRFIIAFGVSGCLITRGTDLSAGRCVGLSACIAGTLLQDANFAGRFYPNPVSYTHLQHLGASIQNMARQIRRLMDDIVAEHESKRKSEFDTLQSQINPHFLYNTLDIIVWMIENERQSEAVKVVTALARFCLLYTSHSDPLLRQLQGLGQHLLPHLRAPPRGQPGADSCSRRGAGCAGRA